MPHIDDILQEFPDLAPRKDDIARILAAMERAGPSSDTLDEAFVTRLRRELMTKETLPLSRTLFHSFIPFLSFFMQQKTFALVTAVLALALVLPAGYALWTITSSNDLPLSGAEDASRIALLDARAFGDLSAASAGGVADGKGGAGEFSKVMSTDPMMYEPTVYVYTYSGDLASYLGDTSGIVYERRVFQPLAASLLDGLASHFSHMDVDTLLDGKLMSFVLASNGYMLSVDTPSNLWSMYKDWSSSPSPEEWTPMTAENLPSDDAILSAAAHFVTTWGIDVRAYGAPVIGESEIALARTGATDVFIPESATVIYPMLVEGNEVYSSWSSAPTGLRISVNLRDLTVTNAYDALTHAYNASSYELTQDTALINTLLAGGGNAPIMYEGMTIHEVVVPLNNPERTLMEYALYENGQSRTLFIPALRFTLQDPSLLPWTSGVVMVPLVKDIAEAQSTNNDLYILGGAAEPMVK